MEFLISIGAKIGEYTVDPVCKQLGYSFQYKANMANLKTKILHLENTKEELQHSIDEARRKDEEIEVSVQNWLFKSTDIIEEANKEIFEHEDHATCRCSIKFLSIVVSRHKLSKKANVMAAIADSEVQIARTFHKISYSLPPQGFMDCVGGYVTFLSRISTLKEIMEALRDPDVRMVAMYGMAGVGKTMLAKEVARQAKEEEKLFNKVVITTVSQAQDLKKIQTEIAEQLGLTLKNETIPVRADQLRRGLLREKKILLILDDIWDKLDLHEVGINFGNDCKILLTSRSRDVVCDEMGADQSFMIGHLILDEANVLFNNMVGDSIKNPDIQPLAAQIVRECQGLPIAIATVANALKNKSYPRWESALQELRRSVPTNIKGMHDKVYSSIKLSYNSLASEEAKALLLVLGLFPEDASIQIEDLLSCGTALGLFRRTKDLGETRNTVHTVVDILKNSCLLLDGDLASEVRMHDVIRDVVIFIASNEKHMYNFPDVRELEDDEVLKGATAISLRDSNRHSQLPKRFECPQLELLLMGDRGTFGWDGLQISDQFFEELKELRVLRLNSFDLKPLPSSFQCLQNLQSLCLYECNIGDAALIGDLKTLKILRICKSHIEELPKQIGQLTLLQLLDLTSCYGLKVIECGAVSSLIHLEELYMVDSFRKWDADGGNSGSRNASLVELNNLSRLSTLHLHIPDAEIQLPKNLFSEKLKRYQILIGRQPPEWRYLYYKSRFSRILGLELNVSRLPKDHCLRKLLKRSEVLCLCGSQGVNNVVYELDTQGFPNLKQLIIEGNDEMQYIAKTMKQNHPYKAFLNLEVLHLEQLTYLEKICHGKLSTNSFGQLRDVRVRDCGRLEYLFSLSIAKELSNIEVIRCEMMKEIVTYGREDDTHINTTNEDVAKIAFPKLFKLCLTSLPELIHFFCSELVTSFPGQMNKELLDVNGPIPLFSKMVAFPSLKLLTLSTLNSEKLWPDQPPETFNMENLKTLNVSGCNSLKYLSTFDMEKNLVQLEELEVSKCILMEELLAIKHPAEIGPYTAFVNLEILDLDNLEKLERICLGKLTTTSFGKLRGVRVRNCDKLKSLFSFAEARFVSQLEEIVVAQCEVMEEIFIHEIEDDHNQNINDKVDDKVEFPQLRSLSLKYLPNFRQVITKATHQRREKQLVANSSTAKVKYPRLRILNLERMGSANTIRDCLGLFEDDDKEDGGILSHLKRLKLRKLPQLMHLLGDENYDPAAGIESAAFQNLKILRVYNCNRLKNLASSSISFQSLLILKVTKCHGMTHLLTSSMARSLTQLRVMIISECEAMIQIVAADDEDDEKGGGEDHQTGGGDDVVLDKLAALMLEKLPNLVNFYSGHNITRLPNLRLFFLSHCPQMQSFCKGDISTPKLKAISLPGPDHNAAADLLESDLSNDSDSTELDEDDAISQSDDDTEPDDKDALKLIEGDINATIRHLQQSNAFPQSDEDEAFPQSDEDDEDMNHLINRRWYQCQHKTSTAIKPIT